MEMLKVRIIAEAIDLQAATQFGQQPFTALITYAGKPSENFVGGTEIINGGPYKVFIPAELLKTKIRELEGKRVFATDTLETHQSPKFVGKFVSAWVEELEDGIVAGKASGLLMRDADPELVDQIVALSRKGMMGFSYDLKDVRFELKASSDGSGPQYIELTDFAWRGATILKRDAAAYAETQLAAHKHEPKEESDMTKEEIQKAVADGMGQAFKEFQSAVIDPLGTELKSSISTVKNEVAELRGKTQTLEAAMKPPDEKKADEKKADEKTGETKPNKLSASDFAAAIAESTKVAIEGIVKPLTDTVTALKTAMEAKKEPEPVHIRKSLSAIELTALKKYGDLDDTAEPTIENYTNAIAMIQQDARLTKEAKGQLLGPLGAQRRALIRAGVGGN